MIKNSLNKRLREYLVQTFSVNNNTCYPNTISDAISLLTTFNKGGDVSNGSNDNVSKEEACVAYHETLTSDNNDTDTIVDDTIEHDEAGITINDDIDTTDIGNNMTEPVNEEEIPHVTFNESVMATIIAEATAEADQNQFIGASFGQLQEVDEVYEEDEPDIVVSAHIIETINEPAQANVPPIDVNHQDRHPNPHREFELIMYHTSQQVNGEVPLEPVFFRTCRGGARYHATSKIL
jgi:hypothetical protein